MLRSVEGKILQITQENVILDVNGFGLDILCSGSALRLCEECESVRLTTYLQVSESGITLFGFSSELERDVFLKLITVKGVGGRVGLAILRTLSPSQVVRSIVASDIDTFLQVPGVGKKTAERLCFELKRHLSEEMIAEFAEEEEIIPTMLAKNTVAAALRSLGFTQNEVYTVMNRLKREMGAEFETAKEEVLLKQALRELKRN
ncbi:MAG: Holliday junction branch migration protein RuvA [Aminobacterium sp.]|uniref:Holliday junction branch migration protein RuvA n=1 Tax=Aminobacterium sp. MB27-C1 TaxID=3070661 RepID=UPI001BCF9EAB|nr:Holliday junction branch migration protein RuvA [Aminobacterium sp. MB27-C1]MDD2207020.1 Holliday junction branch migration protein RuvA [Aminobacterium sp.]MDD3708241.1 Holliday junction branch migration protein RuvA [Aminobacterium sp.]MDD4228955.1 Holliday junction branch migration protein RuvA [Aminobacterium sp.]MDD4551897.1 Holliday junction branch migration protein RuvA [Aminobacterium sp.]WMI72597.1 Holliday junction branch migration protein RuvA [Aminobacterium sp. MB27-C1]